MAHKNLPKIVQDIKDCLHDVKKEYQEGQVPITDDSIPLHKFCAKLEYLLQIDTKARNSVWRGRLDYWDYINSCLSKVKGLNDGVRFVKAMNEVKSSLGRGRALIRYSLVHHRLGDSLQQCFTNSKITSEWYKPNSVLLNPSHYSALINDLYDLNDIQFDLAPTGYDLDTAWPTFARKSHGGNNLHMWTPPSRSSSISSLSSQPSTLTMDGLPSPQEETAYFGLEEQYQKLQKEFDECEQLNRQLRQKIDQLEKDNDETNKLALETEERMGALQMDLERRNQDLDYQVDKITRQLRIKEDEMSQYEDMKERSKEAEKLNADLYARIDVLNMQHESREKLLQQSEEGVKDKLEKAERELSDYKLQVQSLQGEVESRRCSEERRVTQMQELEAKLTGLEGKNVELLARMEGMVQDKDDKVSSHFQSANKVHELLAKLEGVEHEKIVLKSANEELNRKVQELEDLKMKGNTEMEILRGSLDERTREMTESSQQVQGRVSDLKDQNDTWKRENNDLALQVQQLTKAVQDAEAKQKNCEQKFKQDLSDLTANCEELERTKAVLEKQVQSLEDNKHEMVKEHQRVKNKVTQKETELSEMKERISQTVIENQDMSQNLQMLTEKVPQIEGERDEKKQDFDRLTSALSDLLKSSQIDPENSFQSDSNGQINDSSSPDSQLILDKIKAVIEDRSSMHTKLIDAKESIGQLENEMQSVKQQLHNEEDGHKTCKLDLESAQVKLNEFENQVKVMSSDLDGHQKGAEQVKIECSQLQKSVNDRDTAMKDVQSQLHTCQVDLEMIKKEKEGILGELASARENETKLSEKISCMEKDYEDMEKARRVIQERLDKEKQSNKSLENLVDDLRRMQDENVSLEQVFEERKQKMVQDHTDRVEFLTHQFNMIKEDVDKATQEKTRLEEEHETMSDEHIAMREQLEMTLKEKNETKEINHALNTEISFVNEQIKTAQDERQEIALKLEQISDETATLITEKKERISGLEEELEEVTKVKGELESKVDEMENDFEEKIAGYGELEEKSKEMEEQLGSMQSVMEQQVSALKFQLSSEAMQYQDKIQGYKTQEGELDMLREKCSDQQTLIDNQKSQVIELTAELKSLTENSTKQMSEVHNKTAAQEKDFKMLQDTLEEMTKMLEEQKVTNLNLEEELSSIKSDKQSREAQLREQLLLAENDNVELKRNLIKVVKEKDTLWQWTDKLEHQRKMKASERWLEDKEVTKCMQCETEFGLMVRRHHCRSCGRIFCNKCCNSYIQGAQSKNKVRVCEQCFVIHHHSRESENLNTSLLGDEDEENEALIESRLRLESQSSLNSDVSGAAAGGSRIGLLLGPGDLEPSSLEENTQGAKFIVGSVSSTTPSPRTPTPSPGNDSITVLEGAAQNYPPKMNREEGITVIVLDKPEPGAATNMVAEEEDSKGSEEPDFDIISEEEVQSIKSDDLSPARVVKETKSLENSVVCAVMTTKELEAGYGCDEEIQIKAGQSHSIPIQLDEPGLILCWEFASAPKTIAFSVTYKQDVTSEHVEELIPLCKCNSHRHAVQGELMSRKAGVYTLVYDNQFSRFTAKTVKYSLQIKRPEAAY